MAEAQLLHRNGDSQAALDRAMLGLRLGHWLSQAVDADLLTAMIAIAQQGSAWPRSTPWCATPS